MAENGMLDVTPEQQAALCDPNRGGTTGSATLVSWGKKFACGRTGNSPIPCSFHALAECVGINEWRMNRNEVSVNIFVVGCQGLFGRKKGDLCTTSNPSVSV